MAYEPTEKDIETAENWMKSNYEHFSEHIKKGGSQTYYFPFEYSKVLKIMNRYAAWNVREFCKDLHEHIEEWEDSEEYRAGIPIADIFENEIINRFK